jgi:type II secretory pathway pseudopilin PulG
MKLHTRPGLPRSQRSQSGFSLVEVMVLIIILGLGMLALTSTSLSVHSLQSADSERRLANDGLDSVTEDIRQSSSMLIDAELGWVNSLNALYGPGGTPGDTFDIEGLTLQDGDASIGSITIVTDETLTDAELGVEIGMPKDLDNDGEIDNNNVTDTARILPVIVRTAWTGSAGAQQIVEGFYILGY